jgi:hypothetical protein
MARRTVIKILNGGGGGGAAEGSARIGIAAPMVRQAYVNGAAQHPVGGCGPPSDLRRHH